MVQGDMLVYQVDKGWDVMVKLVCHVVMEATGCVMVT